MTEPGPQPNTSAGHQVPSGNAQPEDLKATTDAIQWLESVVSKCTGFTGKRILEVGCDLNGRYLKPLVRNFGATEAVGINPVISQPQELLPGCRVEPGDIRNTSFPDGYFDTILSVSAFEHIQNFDVALEEMHRILRPGGLLYSHFGPIWSGVYGHHLWLVHEGKTYNYWNVVMPAYCHLTMTPPGLLAWCKERFDPVLSQALVKYVFSSPDQNQLWFEDYERLVKASRFTTVSLEGYQYRGTANQYPLEVSSQYLALLSKKYPRGSHFEYDGIKLLLRKGQ